jgi:hypothetical protein
MKRNSLEEDGVMRWEREPLSAQLRRKEGIALIVLHDEQEASPQDFSYLLKHGGQKPYSGLESLPARQVLGGVRVLFGSTEED